MEGCEGGAFAFPYFPTTPPPPLHHHTPPPITAIDRFLHHQHPDSGGIGFGFGLGFPWPPPMQDVTFFDGLLVFDERGNLGDQNLHVADSKTAIKKRESDRRRGKSGRSSVNLIKGQWTEDEDRKLMKLVREKGLRKWAEIAEKLEGRAGKQCRERWHNHLRPDIKKDSWSEAEERLLVEAHQWYGNKWAEIARRIPGRTENSIKNHWNATKRRQNSKRRVKKVENRGEKPPSSILEDYIRSIYQFDSPKNHNVLTSSANTAKPASIYNIVSSENPANRYKTLLLDSIEDQESSPFMDDPCHDELIFMQNFFKNNPITQPPPSPHDVVFIMDSSSSSSSTSSSSPLSFITTIPSPNDHQQSINPSHGDAALTHLYSDLYISYLLDGAIHASTSHVDHYIDYHHHHHHHHHHMDQLNDMDLMEMVSSSQFSHENT